MGLSKETVDWLRRDYPHCFVDGAAAPADVVVIDVTERFMYPSAGVGGRHRPQNCLDMLHLVEEFIADKASGCNPGAVVVALVDDGASVPLEKGVAHATRYGAQEGPVPQMGGGVEGDVVGTEYALPWEEARAAAVEKAPAGRATTMNHEWREITRNRSVRQRLARFVADRLVRTATLGRRSGGGFVVSAPHAGSRELGLEVKAVRLLEGGRREVTHHRGVLPAAAAGEADVQTPLLLRWMDAHRGAMGLPARALSVWVTSKDSDMLPICAALSAALGPDKMRIAALRRAYNSTTRAYSACFVDTTALAEAFCDDARASGRDRGAYVSNLLFAIALSGCDFVKRPKACTPAALAAQVASTPVLSVTPCVTQDSGGLRCGAAYTASARASRDCLRRTWTSACGGVAGSDGLTLRDTLAHIRATPKMGKFRITKDEPNRVEASWRAAVWVAYYWTAAAAGTHNFATFQADCCARAGATAVSRPFGFSCATEDGGRATVSHAGQDDVVNLSLPALRLFG